MQHKGKGKLFAHDASAINAVAWAVIVLASLMGVWVGSQMGEEGSKALGILAGLFVGLSLGFVLRLLSLVADIKGLLRDMQDKSKG